MSSCDFDLTASLTSTEFRTLCTVSFGGSAHSESSSLTFCTNVPSRHAFSYSIGIPKEALLRQVDDFVNTNQLSNGDDFRKGALIAQSPMDFEDLTELSESEKEWIRLEKTHRWRQRKSFRSHRR